MIVVHVGKQGSGKTHALRAELARAARAGDRFLVLDRARSPGVYEWDPLRDAPPALVVAAHGMDRVHEALRDPRVGVVLARPHPRELVDVGDVKTGGPAERLAQLAWQTRGVTLVLPEAQLHVPQEWGNAIPKSLKSMITEWRHVNGGVWADSQRFATLNKNLVGGNDVLRIFALREPADLEAVRRYGSGELVEAVREVCRRFGGDGVTQHPGWHVKLTDATAMGPYQVVR